MMRVLPPNATSGEQALADAYARILDTPVPVRHLWSAANCPAAHLPWLAWALSVDDWHPAWPTDRKRRVIASSFDVHRTKGTVHAVRTALAAQGYSTRIREWHQATPPGQPGTFSVDFERADGFDHTAYDDVTRIALATKNVRSHLIGVRAQVSTRARVTVGSATLCGELVTVYPYQLRAIRLHARMVGRAAALAGEITTVYPGSPH
ncbi:MAG: phage tail protein I [Pseudomonadota bacterium]|nr:phage tail protein I [Pseudomonadota bacterium]